MRNDLISALGPKAMCKGPLAESESDMEIWRGIAHSPMEAREECLSSMLDPILRTTNKSKQATTKLQNCALAVVEAT